jgi:hypothetical protein
VLNGTLDHRKASLLLWALQIASSNSRRVQIGVFTDKMVRSLPIPPPDAPPTAPEPAS